MRESPYALKTAWRFVVLVYGSCAVLGPLFLTSASWAPTSWGFAGGLLVVSAFSVFLAFACCFAFAGAGLAVFSLFHHGVTHRRSATFALFVSLIAAMVLTTYLLFFTGVIDVQNT